jgi:hypothetical protein
MHGLKALVGKLKKQTGFSDSCIGILIMYPREEKNI